MNEQKLNFRIAQYGDEEQVLSLYQGAKGSKFCLWNDSYPSITEIAHDLETNNLYVMTNGSKIIGAISIVPENELDDFACWSCSVGKEIARVVIDKDYQGHGLSYEMVQSIESILRKNGCKAIHLSVAKTNIPAYKTYIKAGFAVVGEAQMYGNDYYLMENEDKMEFKTNFFDQLSTRELYEIVRARQEIFLMEQNIVCRDFDGVDYNALHCFLWENDKVVAYMRAFTVEGEIRLGRFLTLRHGEGLGRRLMELSLPVVKDKFNCEKISFHAQKHAEGFYKKFGFKTVSDVFLEEGIEHVAMQN